MVDVEPAQVRKSRLLLPMLAALGPQIQLHCVGWIQGEEETEVLGGPSARQLLC